MPHINERILEQIREQTETTWRDSKPLTFDEFLAQDKASYIWQQGTKWLGLSDVELNALEKQWSLQFPPDYRLFLKILHCMDKPVIIAKYDANIKKIIPSDAILFQNWLTDTENIQTVYQQLREDLIYDVLNNNLWKSGWGRKPVTRYGQGQQIEKLIAEAPKLIPIYGHCFLLAEPNVAGNPILVLHQSKMLIYSPDFYAFLCKDFPDLLHLDKKELQRLHIESRRFSKERYGVYKRVPFWGELI
ncbi:hypothetical protein KDA_61120 [Dictyobacter alpinus]|uniref:Knr4/Smi1-like domain-containing protein n=1 Tax=Dictyobacter alpinus TaxID=2014873 RepID=A0A402BGR8_9CHLR|nr:SMI1/KNR4 family protein [Dictyobacter alpinus]GCE30628.1 hypothetical protein KDA_61120 [Dictyobacter alpinus]